MKNETYNGWTNYATWRVNLEIFDGFDLDGHKVTVEELMTYAEEVVFEGADENSFAADYSLAFLNQVNWHEIAESMNETNG